MTDAIPISWLNDYIFDPKSIYFHNILADFDIINYHQKPQILGNIAHESLDKQTYTNSKQYLIDKSIYSEEFNLVGKIDIFDIQTKTLIERKKKIHKLYQGQIYQLWAQYYCMLEMGYEINHLKIYSISDNKNYLINIPTIEDKLIFSEFIIQLQNDSNYHGSSNQAKNTTSIYKEYYF